MTAAPRAPAYDFAAEGSAVRLVMSCAEVVLRASGALWLERERALIAADVHFEKGSAYAARGQMLPPYDTRDALRRLSEEIAALEPKVTPFAVPILLTIGRESVPVAMSPRAQRSSRWSGWCLLSTS